MRDALLSGLESLRRNAPEDLLRAVSWLDQGVDEHRIDLLLTYMAELQRWNKTYSLTAIDDPEQMVVRHLLDSLVVAPWVQGRVLDVGTGAGLPGIPLAIMDTELDTTLLDSTSKKIRFLNHVIRKLKLQNAVAEQMRVEEYRSLAPFDTVISRAFSALTDYLKMTHHLLGPRSRVLAMKGRRPDDELANLPDWIMVEAVEKLAVPGLHEDRHLVIMSLT